MQIGLLGFTIFKSPKNSLCLPPNYSYHKLLFSNAPERTEYSQAHFKTIGFAKLEGEWGGGQKECIMKDSKIVPIQKFFFARPHFKDKLISCK